MEQIDISPDERIVVIGIDTWAVDEYLDALMALPAWRGRGKPMAMVFQHAALETPEFPWSPGFATDHPLQLRSETGWSNVAIRDLGHVVLSDLRHIEKVVVTVSIFGIPAVGSCFLNVIDDFRRWNSRADVILASGEDGTFTHTTLNLDEFARHAALRFIKKNLASVSFNGGFDFIESFKTRIGGGPKNLVEASGNGVSALHIQCLFLLAETVGWKVFSRTALPPDQERTNAMLPISLWNTAVSRLGGWRGSGCIIDMKTVDGVIMIRLSNRGRDFVSKLCPSLRDYDLPRRVEDWMVNPEVSATEAFDYLRGMVEAQRAYEASGGVVGDRL